MISTVNPLRSLLMIGAASMGLSFGSSIVLGQYVIESVAITDPESQTFKAVDAVQSLDNHGNYGYTFSATQAITIDQLGFFDYSGTGLAVDHLVGLFDGSGNELRRVTIPAGTTADFGGTSSFRFMDISPITIDASTTYYLSAFYPAGDADSDYITLGTTATTGSNIVKGNATYKNLTDDLTWANDTIEDNAANDGFYGPNAHFTAVPEPQACASAAAMVLLGFAAWRRSRAS
jgi:hypothetical protein